MKRQILFLFLLSTLFSCNHQQEQIAQNTFAPKVVASAGKVVSNDSLIKPTVVEVDESSLKRVAAGNPKVVETNNNIFYAGTPKSVPAGLGTACTPGQDSFAIPKTVTAASHPFLAGLPEVVLVKEANNKDHFSSYGKLQGLKHNRINCLTQDKSGNLWIGTGGGVTRYDGQSFTHFTEKEGLVSNDVSSVLEDKDGSLWFGTDNGVSKYDGKYFTQFTEKDGLGDNDVHTMLQDKNGNIWFGSSAGGGVTKYDGKSFTHFTEEEGLINNDVAAMIEDKSGNIWIATSEGVSKYDGKSFCQFTDKQGLINNDVRGLVQDRTGNFWFTTANGVSEYNGTSFQQFTEREGLSSNDGRSILEDKNGALWFGSYKEGLSKYDGKTFTIFGEQEGLINNIVWSLFQDRSGNLWVGTDGGVSKYDGKCFTHFTEKEGLLKNDVSSILSDKTGKLWFATAGGVSRYDDETFTQFTEKEGLPGNDVYSILQDKNGNIWFGTYGKGICKYDGRYFTYFTTEQDQLEKSINAILEDKNGNIWFGSYDGVSKYDGKSFTHYTHKQGLISDEVYTILEDKLGNIWFGTGGGISKYDGSTFTQFTTKEGLSNNVVESMLQDKNGLLWFGTFGGGVSVYDGKTFTQFTEKEGLINNYVQSLLQDKNGNIWLGTRFGLSKLSAEKSIKVFDKAEQAQNSVFFKNYTYEDGFTGIGCNENSICEAPDVKIWFGASDRLTAYHPNGDVPDTIAPNIQITNIALYNENIAWQNLIASGDAKDTSFLLGNGVSVGGFRFDGISKWYGLPQHLSLAYNNNYLTFNYIGVTQKSPKKVKYKYKLVGFDKNWNALTSSTEAAYGNLDDGNFTFVVKAMNSEGNWSDEFNYSFTIRPPWWKTWWFRTLVVSLIITLIFLYIKWRERALKETQKVLERTVEERTAEVVEEKKEVEKLLLNILPAEVADELKAKGSADAKLFHDVTVLFTDFKGFTTVSEKLTPQQLVDELHACFSAFDEIMGKYNIEKIKTVGDAYLAVSGLPLANHNHAADTVSAAIEIRDFMVKRHQDAIRKGLETFEVRIGVHSGSVVAGIVGIKKYSYDIWGDTVNTAARMEQNSEPGKINISESTYDLVKSKFRCEFRGEIEAKNKGKLKMYFVG